MVGIMIMETVMIWGWRLSNKNRGYTPKAKEAFCKTFIDIGVSILKSIFLLIMVTPITLFIKTLLDEKSEINLWKIVTNDSFFLLCVMISLVLLIGMYLRDKGLRCLDK